jgi:hypothetical protein
MNPSACVPTNGRTYESVGLRPDQIMALHFEPAGSY